MKEIITGGEGRGGGEEEVVLKSLSPISKSYIKSKGKEIKHYTYMNIQEEIRYGIIKFKKRKVGKVVG